jgi:hypothetical protein
VLEQKKPNDEPGLDPGPALIAKNGAISRSIQSQSILPPSCTNSCFMLTIWSSRARNRSPSPVIFGFCGRIVPSDAITESCPPIRGNLENEIASLRGSGPLKPTISKLKTIRDDHFAIDLNKVEEDKKFDGHFRPAHQHRPQPAPGHALLEATLDR